MRDAVAATMRRWLGVLEPKRGARSRGRAPADTDPADVAFTINALAVGTNCDYQLHRDRARSSAPPGDAGAARTARLRLGPRLRDTHVERRLGRAGAPLGVPRLDRRLLGRLALDLVLAHERQRGDRSEQREPAAEHEHLVEPATGSPRAPRARRLPAPPPESPRPPRASRPERNRFHELAPVPLRLRRERDRLGAPRAVKSAPQAAMPTAMPTWRKVSLIPAAMPLRSFGTTLSATSATAVLTIPTPMPATMKPGSSAVQPSAVLRPDIRSSPRPAKARPTASCARAATRETHMPERPATTKVTIVSGR